MRSVRVDAGPQASSICQTSETKSPFSVEPKLVLFSISNKLN